MYLRPGKFFRNQILLDYLGRWRNQSCQIFFQSVHSGVYCKGSNFAIFSVNRGWPLQLLYYRTTVINFLRLILLNRKQIMYLFLLYYIQIIQAGLPTRLLQFTYSGISQANLNKLQRIQNSLAFGTRHYKHFTISTHHTNTKKTTLQLLNRYSTTYIIHS